MSKSTISTFQLFSSGHSDIAGRWRAAWLTIHAILIALTATLGAWRDQR